MIQLNIFLIVWPNRFIFTDFDSSSHIDRLVNLKLSVISMGKLIGLTSMV
jgi:hypothetical protein